MSCSENLFLSKKGLNHHLFTWKYMYEIMNTSIITVFYFRRQNCPILCIFKGRVKKNARMYKLGKDIYPQSQSILLKWISYALYRGFDLGDAHSLQKYLKWFRKIFHISYIHRFYCYMDREYFWDTKIIISCNRTERRHAWYSCDVNKVFIFSKYSPYELEHGFSGTKSSSLHLSH